MIVHSLSFNQKNEEIRLKLTVAVFIHTTASLSVASCPFDYQNASRSTLADLLKYVTKRQSEVTSSMPFLRSLSLQAPSKMWTRRWQRLKPRSLQAVMCVNVLQPLSFICNFFVD